MVLPKSGNWRYRKGSCALHLMVQVVGGALVYAHVEHGSKSRVECSQDQGSEGFCSLNPKQRASALNRAKPERAEPSVAERPHAGVPPSPANSAR